VERFDREVRNARAAARLEQAKAAAAFDRLTPTQIDYLGSVFVHDRRTGMDQRVQEGHARASRPRRADNGSTTPQIPKASIPLKQID
jgi:hypothetical protein